jgi:alkylation response protein AidB-like acyl-CoA dehydrogenase
MADGSNIVVETALRILQDHSTPAVVNDAEAGQWPEALWNTLEESGLTLAWVPDTLGGAGAEVADGFGVLRIAGEFAAPVPLAETLMAGFLLARAGLQVPEGPMTVAPIHALDRLELDPDGRLHGVAHDIPFARWARHIVVLVRRGEEDCVALVATADATLGHGQSLSGEPCDRISFEGVTPRAVTLANGVDAQALAALGATVRSVQMAGALKRSLDQALLHAADRVQFGRPIGNFQVIQHNLAQFAGEVAAATAAADAAAEAIGAGGLTDEATLAEIATAKIRVGEAAGVGSAIAHQVHGAMGFTYEHSLHHATRRLWAWRDEFGNEAHWSVMLGGIAARQGADAFWPFVSGAGH